MSAKRVNAYLFSVSASTHDDDQTRQNRSSVLINPTILWYYDLESFIRYSL